jgi:hypothetical protein
MIELWGDNAVFNNNNPVCRARRSKYTVMKSQTWSFCAFLWSSILARLKSRVVTGQEIMNGRFMQEMNNEY